MARLALYHDAVNEVSALRVTRDNADAPWDLDVEDYGKFIFDSLNPDQIEVNAVFTLSRDLFPNTAYADWTYYPPGSDDSDADYYYWNATGGLEACQYYELTKNRYGYDYPNVGFIRKYDANGWLLGNTITTYEDQSSPGGGEIATGGYLDVFTSLSMVVDKDFENYAAWDIKDTGYDGWLHGSQLPFASPASSPGSNLYPVGIVHLDLPADNRPIDVPTGSEEPGQVVARASNLGFQVARPGFDIDAASGKEFLIDSSRAPLRIVVADEVTINTGATHVVELPSGISYGDELFVDYICWKMGESVLHPPAYQGGSDTRSEWQQYLKSKMVSGELNIWNPTVHNLNVRYIVFGSDENEVTSGSSKVFGVYEGSTGEDDYIQIRRPGAADPPTLKDVLLDTRFPYCPIIADGYWSVPHSSGIQSHTVSFANDGSFKPYPIAMARIRYSPVFVRHFYSGMKARLLIHYYFPGGSQTHDRKLSGDSCYAEITDTSVTFRADPTRPSYIGSNSGSFTFDYSTRIENLRYYILALPIS